MFPLPPAPRIIYHTMAFTGGYARFVTKLRGRGETLFGEHEHECDHADRLRRVAKRRTEGVGRPDSGELMNEKSYKQAQEQFGRAAEAYTQSPVFAEGEDLGWLVEQAGPIRHARALDIGTGAGHAAFALSRCAGHIIGFDITPQMVQAACRNARERGIESFAASVGNAEHLPFPDESISLVVCRYTGHHFHEPARVVREVARVLTADGRFLVVDNTSPDDPIADRWINTVEVLRDPSHVREWSQGEWQRFFRDAGLDFAVTHTWLKMLEFDDWVARQQTPPEAVAELRALFDSAPPAIREMFALDATQFGLLTRLMVGRKL